MLYIHFLSSRKLPPSASQNLNKFENHNFQDDLHFDQQQSKKAIELIRKLQQTYYLERKLFF
ncbi:MULTISPECIES: hypothetical protein [Fischerella]|uniref:Uncharacterized protein n=1 Tax=Fischerella muscicola CCMEE 5323 TaxID=2019572 RepID=A0A2N6K835_FISMU|nr:MULTISPECIES: hypothetical protein [Fischerella]PLZ93622.1 hypothetical protein CEN44_02825 [Fischerella muscicola CCMEE 5323]